MKEILSHIAEFVAQNCTADDYTLNVEYSDSHETRFAQNAITQHIAGSNINIYLETVFAGKTGSASINQDDPEALKRLITTAENTAKLNQEDPEYVPSQGFCDIPKCHGAADATMYLNPEKMVDIVKASIANAHAKSASVSGMCEKHYQMHLTATKNGFFGIYDNSYFGHSMTLKKDAVETKVSYSSRDYATFKLMDTIGKLNTQFDSLGKPQSFDPQKIAVILRPSALMDFFGFLAWTMNRRYADEGFSPYTDQLGQSFFGKDFSLASLISDPDLSSTPFSHDAITAKDTSWVKDGVLANMPTDRYWAKKLGIEPLRGMRNLYIPGGDISEAEMLQMVPKGLIINRFWYIRTVDPKRGELTGMTRDGVLYFENGKVSHAVNNLRFNEIPHEVTRRILAMGKSILCESDSKMPTLLVEDFNFVDKTDF